MTETCRILVVEDEKPMLLGLVDSLQLEGFEVYTAEDGLDGLEKAQLLRPDAVVLDIMLPKLSGTDVCQELRSRGDNVPILMLSARSQESDKVLALGIGADDYVCKPFSISELTARLRALVRRSRVPVQVADRYQFADVAIDFRHMTARKGDRPIPMTHLEFEVMKYLLDRSGDAVARDDLLRKVWNYRSYSTTRAVDNLIARLRKKLEDDPAAPVHLLTIHSFGYKFVA